MPDIKTKCPHCGHTIIIPASVTHYVCICGKEFKIVINELHTTPPKQT